MIRASDSRAIAKKKPKRGYPPLPCALVGPVSYIIFFFSTKKLTPTLTLTHGREYTMPVESSSDDVSGVKWLKRHKYVYHGTIATRKRPNTLDVMVCKRLIGYVRDPSIICYGSVYELR